MENKTKLLILPILLLVSIFTSGCTNITQNNNINNPGDINNTTGEIIGMANPASVYCEENGGTLEPIFDNGETYNMCHFENGTACEEREFFRKECFPKSEDGEAIDKIINGEDTPTKDPIICTQEAKECLDGSYVSREGPDCNFKQCPTQISNTTTGNNTTTIEKETITDILENHANSSGQQEEGLTEADIDLMEAIIEKLK